MASVILSIAMLLLGVLFAVTGLQTGYGTAAQPEPGMIPGVIGLLTILLATMDLWVRIPEFRAASGGSSFRAGWGWSWLHDPRAHFVALTGLIFLLIEPLGTAPAFAVYAVLSSRLLGLKRWGWSLVFGLVVALLVHYVFVGAFEISLPDGYLWDMLGVPGR